MTNKIKICTEPPVSYSTFPDLRIKYEIFISLFDKQNKNLHRASGVYSTFPDLKIPYVGSKSNFNDKLVQYY